MTDRRFIEESFPVKEVSVISAKEKNIRHGHISTLHIWWARRPLASSRATAYAALTPPAGDELEWQRRGDFIVELSRWENSLNPHLLERARREILEANGGRPPRVLDPFAGGGAIPLEALRLGCETYASDYNPVAVLILKATLEYPQRFGHPGNRTRMDADATDQHGLPQNAPKIRENPSDPWRSVSYLPGLLDETSTVNPLLEAVKRWGDWVLEEARKELGRFYPPDPDGSIPVGYIWARTIPCQNPACGTEIPLMRQFWLAKKAKKKVALYPVVEWDTDDTDATDQHGLPQNAPKIRENPSDPCRSVCHFRIVGDGYDPWPEDFDPGTGTVSRAVATCLVCGGAVVDANTTRRLFQEGKAGQRMVAVVLHHPKRPPSPGSDPEGSLPRREDFRPGGKGKTYRVATEADEAVYGEAEEVLQAKRVQLMMQWGMDPVPDEPLPPVGTLGFRVQRYGLLKWGDLFNSRQKLALITFAEKVRQAHERMVEEGAEPQFATAVVTYLALVVDKLATFQNVLTRWNIGSTSFAGKPDQEPNLAMKWDHAESHPFSGVTGGFSNQARSVLNVLAEIQSVSGNGYALQSSATKLQHEGDHFDAVLTDPPYYDNFPYSYLSDFFYVWLKRTVGHLHPDLFSTPLTPKVNEIVAYSNRKGGFEAGKRFFEDNLKRAFQEVHRILKPNGIAVIVYAHKSTSGWETVINALLDSGLVMTGAWPLSTERKARQRAQESAALASSIYIVARKMARQPTGFYNEVREELRGHLERKLHRLWEEGIGGADFFIAAIGSAIEVFGKYEQVMDYEGNIVRADRLLEEVRTIATDYAVRQILRDGFAGEVSDLTRLYVLWRWNFGEARVPFDEARKLAQSCHVDLAQEWARGGFVRKEKEFVRLLGPQQRKLEDVKSASELIDVLHVILLLWEKGQREAMVQLLAATGYGRSEAFYRVAQAVSETLPNESREKKLLDGFLAGRERVRDEVGKMAHQMRLWE